MKSAPPKRSSARAGAKPFTAPSTGARSGPRARAALDRSYSAARGRPPAGSAPRSVYGDATRPAYGDAAARKPRAAYGDAAPRKPRPAYDDAAPRKPRPAYGDPTQRAVRPPRPYAPRDAGARSAVVTLDADVSHAFPDSQSVNAALRLVIQLQGMGRRPAPYAGTRPAPREARPVRAAEGAAPAPRKRPPPAPAPGSDEAPAARFDEDFDE